MFGLFQNKRQKPTVNQEDKIWIEESFVWFIHNFGLERIRKQPFIEPTHQNFPYTDFNDATQFESLFVQLCAVWEVNPDDINIKIFDDFQSKQWTNWSPLRQGTDASGLYSQNYPAVDKLFNIQIAKSNLNHPQLLVYLMAHELAHVKLLGGNFIHHNDKDLEPLTDLACIFFGFGVVLANSVITKDFFWINRHGYLPSQIISYANALLCYISDYDSEKLRALLNTNTNDLFKQDFDFLQKTHDTLLHKQKVFDTEQIYLINTKIDDGYNNYDYEAIIHGSQELLKINPKDTVALCNLGYAYSKKEAYSEAIAYFTQAISINPYWVYPYWNRGYCKLKIGDYENAFWDSHHALEMEPHDAYCRRNMGIYFLEIKNFEQALLHFEEAQKLNPNTESINFYLGQVHELLNNKALAQSYFDKSKELKEEKPKL